MTTQLIIAIATVCQFSVAQYGVDGNGTPSFNSQISCQKKLIECVKAKEKAAKHFIEGDVLAECVLSYK